jgi:predicted alpha-1,2-mannosidase
MNSTLKRILCISLVLTLCCSVSFAQKNNPVAPAKQPIDYVNTIIGTNGMGHTFPGACVPFGFVQISPDTDTIPHNIKGEYQPRAYEYCAGYQHKDNTIVGFSHTHFNGTGHSDMGDVLVMPYTGKAKLNPGTAANPDAGYRSRFSHETEISKPGYYEVRLSDDNILCRFTATPHCGIHQYTYPEKTTPKVIIDLNHAIYNYDGKVLWANMRVEDEYTVSGYRITSGWARENYVYFVIHFNRPITNYGYEDKAPIDYKGFWKNHFDVNHNFPEMAGRKIVSWFEFAGDDAEAPVLEMRVALSAVSTEGALKNLETELLQRYVIEQSDKTRELTHRLSFDELCKMAADSWNKELSVIEAQGNDDQMAMLYTSLYHTMINPSIYMDVDGRYRGIDHQIHQIPGETVDGVYFKPEFTNYTVFSLWDTYRAFHPLMNIIKQQRNTDMVKSMLAHYSQSVHHALPVWSHAGNENWCMIGYHAVSVLADAIAKGLDIDKDAALMAMISSSNVDYYDNIGVYKKRGFVPIENTKNAASVTLEYAYDDWTIYHTAQLLGKDDVAKEYYKRALYYKNVFDTDLGYARPRDLNGNWKKNFSLLATANAGFIEGNSLNYSFYVPHNVNDLIKLMGGDKRFIAKMDSLFTMHLPAEFFAETEDVTEEGLLGGYIHGNEPSHHIPYLYNWTSQPWKTQYWVREIMNKMYRNNIDGLCGNDDCGQMSAWYVLSAMGFYAVCPGTDQYSLAAPSLPYMKINLENGKTFVIKANNVSDKNRYVKSVTLNGKPYNKLYITQQDIMNGGEIIFQMTSKPAKERKFTAEERGYSMF